MNANELADIQAFKTKELTIWERNTTATMLRQQQAEIEALKQSKSDGNNKVNSKPVAWAVWEGSVHDMFFTKEDADELCRLKGGDAKSVPLYTHPAELTDEEIIKVYEDMLGVASAKGSAIDFARAILRKAQNG